MYVYMLNEQYVHYGTCYKTVHACVHVTRTVQHVYMLQEQYMHVYKLQNCTHCVHVTTIEAYVYKGNLHNF